LPQTVTEDDDLIFSELILFRQKLAAHDRVRTDNFEVTGRDCGPIQLLGIAVARQGHRRTAERRDVFKDSVLFFPVEEVRGCDAPLAMLRHVLPNRHESIGSVVRQRIQQHCADDAEDRRVRTDPQSQRDHSDERHAGVLREHSQSVPNVLKHICVIRGWFYSYLSAIIGSTFAALRAGIRHATSATPANSSGTATNVNGSEAFTPNNNELIKRVNANDATRPIPTPSSVSPMPFFNTSPRIFPCVAPSAIRTPISFVCCVTKYASTP